MKTTKKELSAVMLQVFFCKDKQSLEFNFHRLWLNKKERQSNQTNQLHLFNFIGSIFESRIATNLPKETP